MAIKNLNKENILVKVDQNNLISIDPNTIIEDGLLASREINQEKLVIYANLEADVIPRTTLSVTNEKTTLKSIAKGTLNFLNNKSGRDYDTSWSDVYIDLDTIKSSNENDIFYRADESGQSFGIDSINVEIKANFIPYVKIKFTDVRGKTLFESQKNSPYNAFFHLPWPIFYLTLKGYFGKSIRYKLHMVNFNSSYNEINGNFDIETTFVGSTYAYLNDIQLSNALNAPYMFSRESETISGFNEQRGVYEKIISKSSKGYLLLKSVYDEMKQKNLIPQDFPVRTIREVGIIAESLDKLLEKAIFDEIVNPNVLNAANNYSKALIDFHKSVQEWGEKYLTSQYTNSNGVKYYKFDYTKNRRPTSLSNNPKILSTTESGSLGFILTNYKKQLNYFSNIILSEQKKGNFKTPFLTNIVKPLRDYVRIHTFTKIENNNNEDSLEKENVVAIDELVTDIENIRRVFDEEIKKLEDIIEKKMNEVIKGKNGIGFEPTIRNLIAVILANAEVYIRLMKDTHLKAFDANETRKSLIKSFNDETKGDAIYPWPQITKKIPGKNKNVTAYPGEPELRNQLISYDAIVWPEVSFTEDYLKTASFVSDPNTTKEGGVGKINYVFSTDDSKTSVNPLNTLLSDTNYVPYIDTAPSSFLYEIYERAKLVTLIDSFKQNTIEELAEIEFSSIQNVVKDELILSDILSKNINTFNDLLDKLEGFSPIQNIPYLQDGLPTTEYIKNIISKPFSIIQYTGLNNKYAVNNEQYSGLIADLASYKAETYRKYIYPFNSDLYLKYVNKTSADELDFSKSSIFSTNEADSLIITNNEVISWVKPQYLDNLFSQNIEVGNNNTNILNTPYFHKQLKYDFDKTTPYGRYSGSAYLLLNSLGFKELDDFVDPKNTIRMSSMLKEIGSAHIIPYFLILKWGSIYHRYKKFILDGEDILSGFLDSGYTTTNIDGDEFFDNSLITGFTIDNSLISGYTIERSNNKDVGVHPFYDAIYCQIINGYNHWTVTSPSSYEVNVSDNTIITDKKNNGANLNYWSTIVDNSKFTANDDRYSILPSSGYNVPTKNTSFDLQEQNNFRILWEDQTTDTEFSGKTFPSCSEYNRILNSETNIYDLYAIGDEYKKIIDLIGVFEPQILNKFEDIFLEFSSELLNVEIDNSYFSDVTYSKFQELLKDISSVTKSVTSNTNIQTIISEVKRQQSKNITLISDKLLQTNNLLKLTLGNPKEISSYVFEGFSGLLTNSSLTFDSYSASDSTPDNLALLDLYIGEYPDSGTTYEDFFIDNNIKLTEDNILLLRPLILIYFGYKKLGSTSTFKDYIKESILTYKLGSEIAGLSSSNNRLNMFLTRLTGKFSKLEKSTDTLESIKFSDGYNYRALKLEMYNNFKSFNDKWTSGNSIGQKLLLEEFLFLDKANADIGDKAYLNIDKFKDLNDSANVNLSVYGAISHLIAGTGFDMRPLPAYVNFYGLDSRKFSRVKPSSSVADDLFGTFLDVDYEDSEPKIIIQLSSAPSSHINNPESEFKDDSFDITESHNNPLIITSADSIDTELLKKSNKVVAFEVSFGDQNQSIFKGVSLNQSTLQNTSMSNYVLEQIGRSESGASAFNVDVNLYDYYRLASYSCEVTCMGNAMIQPTMFFYIKNIPLFKGTYWITEVTHSIANNTMKTTFKGVRLPRTALPDLEDSFTANYRPLFEKILKKAIVLTNSVNNTNGSDEVINTREGNYSVFNYQNRNQNEELVNEAGVTEFGVAYNGYLDEKYIQKIKLKDTKEIWLRAIAVTMGGKNYQIDTTTDMSILGSFVDEDVDTSYIKWDSFKDDVNSLFYSTRFHFNENIPVNNLKNATTLFYNPRKQRTKSLGHAYSLYGESKYINAPINNGPNSDTYSMGLSIGLMKYLGLQDGDVIYFKINK